jgi:phosphatidylinositol 4-kinase type 2
MRDADFKERMFVKQIAVMKGQAWNVVETLKSPDHGPLELIRRARVCVWDDLVDIPVAVPLRRQSSELRRKTPRLPIQEEMDISAAGTSASKDGQDLVALGSPEQERQNPFNISRQSNQLDHADKSALNGRTLSPPNVQAMTLENGSPRQPHASRTSLDESRRHRQHHDRRLSHSSRLYRSITDEDEADLGYSAALGRESNRKKVIVERLENVKSKNPVFTWC